MSKPPATPPHSDIDGVHQDGTRPSKPFPAGEQGGADLARAAREDAARPPSSPDDWSDDRSR